MMESDTEGRLSGRLVDTADSVEGGLDEQRALDPVVLGDSSAGVRAHQHKKGFRSPSLVALIRERLEQHPHFRGRASLLQIELFEGTIVLSGCLPSYYLKQLLQEAIRPLLGLVGIDNQVLIMGATP